MKIRLRNDERVIFTGRTGSGKTVLAKHFLKRINRVLVVDPKHTFRLEEFDIKRGVPVLGTQFKVIYRPRAEDDSHLAYIMTNLMKRKYVTIYCDELATLAETFPLSTAVLTDIVRTGRERFVSVWAATQRPRWIPRVFFTEAESVFMFQMRGADDRKYVAQFVTPDAEDEIERYTFWYAHADEEQAALMRLDLVHNYIEKIG